MKTDVIKWDLYSGRGTVKSKNAFIGFMELLHENGHELLSDYVNNKTKVLINFGCEHDPRWVRPGDYKIGVRCPKCKVSKGEKVILDYLTENEFNVVSQYRIDGYNYKYDIYIFASIT